MLMFTRQPSADNNPISSFSISTFNDPLLASDNLADLHARILPKKLFIATQVVHFSFHTATLLYNIINFSKNHRSSHGFEWFLYYSHWSLALNFVFAAHLLAPAYKISNSFIDIKHLKDNYLPLNFLATTIAVIDTLLYWVAENPVWKINDSAQITFDNLFIHGFPALLLLVNNAVNNLAYIPPIIGQFFLPAFVGLIYIATNAASNMAGLTSLLYNVIDWNEGLAKVLLSCGIIEAAHVAVPGLYAGFKKIINVRGSDTSETTVPSTRYACPVVADHCRNR